MGNHIDFADSPKQAHEMDTHDPMIWFPANLLSSFSYDLLNES